MALKFGIKNAPKNRLSERDLKAAFYEIEPGYGLTANQLMSLMEKTSKTKEYELITIEGEDITAMGLIDMKWYEKRFGFDPVQIERFVTKVIDGYIDEEEDDIYLLRGAEVFIGCPTVY